MNKRSTQSSRSALPCRANFHIKTTTIRDRRFNCFASKSIAYSEMRQSSRWPFAKVFR
uniref:Uncharacterized protein n=1 Tax=Ascaris lumbricoides TaxID=6252 RepID=A0A0M3ITR5_ASCLU